MQKGFEALRTAADWFFSTATEGSTCMASGPSPATVAREPACRARPRSPKSDIEQSCLCPECCSLGTQLVQGCVPWPELGQGRECRSAWWVQSSPTSVRAMAACSRWAISLVTTSAWGAATPALLEPDLTCTAPGTVFRLLHDK